MKYLFVSIVYLKLKHDLYSQMGDFLFEIGLDDLINAYGAEGINEITHRNIWKYLTFTKAIIKDYNFDIEIKFNSAQKKSLLFCYLDKFLAISDKVLQTDPNYFNFNEKKIKRVFEKLYGNYDYVEDILRSRKKMNFACGLFQISLRVLDINLTLLDIVNKFKEDPRFNNIHYFSAARVMQEVCIQSVLKFSNLVKYYKDSREITLKKLGKMTWFL